MMDRRFSSVPVSFVYESHTNWPTRSLFIFLYTNNIWDLGRIIILVRMGKCEAKDILCSRVSSDISFFDVAA
jgi:hypothetical protein